MVITASPADLKIDLHMFLWYIELISVFYFNKSCFSEIPPGTYDIFHIKML